MVKNIVFDFGKVLVDYDFAIAREFLDNEEEVEVFNRLFTDPVFVERCDREDEPFGDIILDMQRQYPEHATMIRAFDEHYEEFVTGEIAGMRTLLQTLKENGFKLYGLTNWCSKVYETIEKYPIFRLLDGYVISSEEHEIKPFPTIYRILCERYGLAPADCLFVDDRLANIEGAESIGMQGIVFRDAKQLTQALKEQGIIA